MTRLEIVHLRLTGPRPDGLVRLIRDSVVGQRGLVGVRIYRRAAVGSDLGIHLTLAGDPADSQVDELGLRLTDALKTYGMVEHSVWTEVAPAGQPRGAHDADTQAPDASSGH